MPVTGFYSNRTRLKRDTRGQRWEVMAAELYFLHFLLYFFWLASSISPSRDTSGERLEVRGGRWGQRKQGQEGVRLPRCSLICSPAFHCSISCISSCISFNYPTVFLEAAFAPCTEQIPLIRSSGPLPVWCCGSN